MERFYYNYTSKGDDTLSEKKYNKVPFKYSLALPLQKENNYIKIIPFRHIRWFNLIKEIAKPT